MEKFIEIYDDIVPSKLINSIEESILDKSMKWTYVQNITAENSKKYLPGFINRFISKALKLYEPRCFYFSQILYYLANKLDINIIDIIRGRAFLQLPTTKSISNDIHVDLDFSHWVCLYYVCDSDGDTIFYDDNENEIKRISPKKGRIAFFDGSIKHCSSTPSKTHRIIINFDFIGKKL